MIGILIVDAVITCHIINIGLVIKHIGDVRFQTTNVTNCLSEVLHVPTITKNLIFVGQIVEKGYQVRFTSKGCYVEDPRKQFKIIAKGTKQDRLFTMEVKMHDSQVMFVSHDNKSIAQLDLWHKRLGHVNVQKLKQCNMEMLFMDCQISKGPIPINYVKHVNLVNNLDYRLNVRNM